MNIHLARHFGMCFGVRDALRATHEAARVAPVTILGQLVHNPLVDAHLRSLGVHQGELSESTSSTTPNVVITAHGASDKQRAALAQANFRIIDTTCPLVHKAHDALKSLVEEGFFPIVIGQASHVEVKGLIGDFPQAIAVLEEGDIRQVPSCAKIGVISQTTQPLPRVLELVDQIKRCHPRSEVRFVDTVCHPTKQRQQALEELCGRCDTMVVIGGRNSNNTRQLSETARSRGLTVHQIESPEELQPTWFRHSSDVGVTAGTSTLDETVRETLDRLQQIAAETNPPSLWASLYG
jgi:4-hydroxy-3-methylbut-2-enyl diphosphate reductase